MRTAIHKHRSSRNRHVAFRTPIAEEIEFTASASTVSAESSSKYLGKMSQAQVTGMVLLIMGGSRILEWKHAVAEQDEGGYQHGNDDYSTMCITYLTHNETSSVSDTEAICGLPSTVTLMHLKQDTSLQLFGLVMAMMFTLWRSESVFRRLNMLLCISPIMSTMALAYHAKANYVLHPSKAFSLMTTCFVSLVVACPCSDCLPFASKRANKSSFSFSSLALLILTFLTFYEVVLVAASAGMVNLPGLLVDFLVPDVWWPQFRIFLHVLLIERCTLLLIIAFAWYHFEEGRQRRFLFFCTLFKGCDYYFQQLQYDEDISMIRNLSEMQNLALGGAILSGLASVFPSFGSP